MNKKVHHVVIPTMFAGLLALGQIANADDKVLVYTNGSCYQVPGLGKDELILAPVLLGLAADITGQLVKTGVDKLIAYLKDDTSMTVIGYGRAGSLSANTQDAREINPGITCIIVAVGDMDEDAATSGNTATSTALAPKTLDALKQHGMAGTPKVYLEAQFIQPKGQPLYFRPKFIYYGEHLKSGGLFGNHKRDLGITIDFLSLGGTAPFFTNTFSFSNVSPGTSKDKLEHYGTPWIGTFSDANKGAFSIRATVIETGKANTIDTAIAQALSDSESSIVSAAKGAVQGNNGGGAAAPAPASAAGGAKPAGK